MPLTESQKSNSRRSGLLLAAIALGFFILIILKYALMKP